eukprot:Sspe_Gene.67583::Locus_39873_Transcript_1_1_Confidence_1.000_Length_1008::g.67583::m.67583
MPISDAPIYLVSMYDYKAEFVSIVEALGKVSPPARLMVSDAAYFTDPLVVDSTVDIICPGAKVCTIESVRAVAGARATISGAEIKNGVVVEGGCLRLENCVVTLEDPFAPISIAGGGSLELVGCTVRGSPEAVHVMGSAVIRGCQLEGSAEGKATVVVEGVLGNLLLLGSQVRGNGVRCGVTAFHGGKVSIERSIIDGFTQIGVISSGGGECSLLSNTIKGGRRALILHSCPSGLLVDNTVHGPSDMFDVRDGMVEVEGNTFLGPDEG